LAQHWPTLVQYYNQYWLKIGQQYWPILSLCSAANIGPILLASRAVTLRGPQHPKNTISSYPVPNVA